MGACSMKFAWARIRRPLASLTLAAIAGSSLSACSDKTFGPNVDCTDVGFVFIELNPEPTGIESYDVNAGESIQVVASLRQVTASEPSFNPLQGWSCRTIQQARSVNGFASGLLPVMWHALIANISVKGPSALPYPCKSGCRSASEGRLVPRGLP